MKLLQKGVTHIGVGTPGRISALIENGNTHTCTTVGKYVKFDSNVSLIISIQTV